MPRVIAFLFVLILVLTAIAWFTAEMSSAYILVVGDIDVESEVNVVRKTDAQLHSELCRLISEHLNDDIIDTCQRGGVAIFITKGAVSSVVVADKLRDTDKFLGEALGQIVPVYIGESPAGYIPHTAVNNYASYAAPHLFLINTVLNHLIPLLILMFSMLSAILDWNRG